MGEENHGLIDLASYLNNSLDQNQSVNIVHKQHFLKNRAFLSQIT